MSREAFQFLHMQNKPLIGSPVSTRAPVIARPYPDTPLEQDDFRDSISLVRTSSLAPEPAVAGRRKRLEKSTRVERLTSRLHAEGAATRARVMRDFVADATADHEGRP
jgi:hypothetical protein